MGQDAHELTGSDLYIEWIRIIDVDLNEYLVVMQWRLCNVCLQQHALFPAHCRVNA